MEFWESDDILKETFLKEQRKHEDFLIKFKSFIPPFLFQIKEKS